MRIINSGFSTDREGYLDWDFGYKCYMPQHIVVENFESALPERTYVFNSINNAAFDESRSNCYEITKSVTFKGCEPLPICELESSSVLREKVKVICE